MYCTLPQWEHYREMSALCRTAWDWSVLPGKSHSGNDEALMGQQSATCCREMLSSRINVPYHPYLSALTLFHSAVVKLQLFQCFHDFLYTVCKWKVHSKVIRVNQFWSVSRDLTLYTFRTHFKVKSLHSNFAGADIRFHINLVCLRVCLLACVCVSTSEVILTASYFKACVWREVLASVVSGFLLLQVSVGVDIEKTGWFTWDIPNSSQPPGSVHTPAFLFCFPIWTCAQWDMASRNWHILVWTLASLLLLLSSS